MLDYTRTLLRSSLGRRLTAAIALGYALLSMLSSGMLRFLGTGRTGVEWSGTLSGGPGIVVSGGGWTAYLPLESLAISCLVAAATGIGLAAAILLSLHLSSAPGQAKKGTGAAASIAALTPAMMAMVTLGACCSTVAAASSGLVSGAGTGQFAVGAWTFPSYFMGLAQLALLNGALMAQERLLQLFADLFGIRPKIDLSPARRGLGWTRRAIADLPFTAFRGGLALAGSVAFGFIAAPALGTSPPGELLVIALFREAPLAWLALATIAVPPLVALLASRRTVGWIRPALRGLLVGLGSSYGSPSSAGSESRESPRGALDEWRVANGDPGLAYHAPFACPPNRGPAGSQIAQEARGALMAPERSSERPSIWSPDSPRHRPGLFPSGSPEPLESCPHCSKRGGSLAGPPLPVRAGASSARFNPFPLEV